MASFDDYHGDGDNVSRLPLRLQKARPLDPEQINPRQWLYGTALQRRYTTILVAAGGTGKSQLALGMALDLASGRKLFGFHIFERAPVWILNLEDDEDELDRRIAAFRMVHNIAWSELDNYLFVHSGRERPVCMARVDPEDGTTIMFPDKDEMIACIRAGNIGLIVIDPFIRSHQLDENSNPQMDAAVAAWNDIAELTGCSILLVHHVRKGIGGTIEAARGAKALTDAARVGFVLAAMTAEEATEIDIPEGEAHRFVRLDGAKSNMAPAAQAIWFEMIERNLGNARPLYPAGDTVSALSRWTKPSAFDALDQPTLAAIFAALRRGPGNEEQFTLTRQGRINGRWAGFAIMQTAGLSEDRATTILDQWARNGVVTGAEYMSAQQRKLRTGIRLDDERVAAMLAATGWQGGSANADF